MQEDVTSLVCCLGQQACDSGSRLARLSGTRAAFLPGSVAFALVRMVDHDRCPSPDDRAGQGRSLIQEEICLPFPNAGSSARSSHTGPSRATFLSESGYFDLLCARLRQAEHRLLQGRSEANHRCATIFVAHLEDVFATCSLTCLLRSVSSPEPAARTAVLLVPPELKKGFGVRILTTLHDLVAALERPVPPTAGIPSKDEGRWPFYLVSAPGCFGSCQSTPLTAESDHHLTELSSALLAIIADVSRASSGSLPDRSLREVLPLCSHAAKGVTS